MKSISLDTDATELVLVLCPWVPDTLELEDNDNFIRAKIVTLFSLKYSRP